MNEEPEVTGIAPEVVEVTNKHTKMTAAIAREAARRRPDRNLPTKLELKLIRDCVTRIASCPPYDSPLSECERYLKLQGRRWRTLTKRHTGPDGARLTATGKMQRLVTVMGIMLWPQLEADGKVDAWGGHGSKSIVSLMVLTFVGEGAPTETMDRGIK